MSLRGIVKGTCEFDFMKLTADGTHTCGQPPMAAPSLKCCAIPPKNIWPRHQLVSANKFGVPFGSAETKIMWFQYDTNPMLHVSILNMVI